MSWYEQEVAHSSAAARKRREAESESGGPEGPSLGHHPDAPMTPAKVMHLQRTAGNATASRAVEEERSPVHEVVGKGGGSPMPESTRNFMESRFGHDFSDVRVHTGGKASESAKSIQAHAYTVGRDIVFQGDRYQPGSQSGDRMLAHELTHVVQQRQGPVAGTPQAGGIKVSDPSDSFERAAEATADKVLSGGAPDAAASTPAAPSAQRAEDEEEAQTYAQRDEDEEDAAQTYAQRAAEEERGEEEQEA